VVGLEQPERPITLDTETLTPIVRRALAAGRAVVTAWSVAPIGYAAFDPVQRRLFRVSGEARLDDSTRRWSTVLKVLQLPAGTDPSTLNPYDNDPRRELAFYASGLPPMMSGLVAPRLFGRGVQPDGSVWLWLEDVADEGGREWPLERYALAARALGRFNGACSGCVPDDAWLARGRWGPRAATRPVFHAAGVLIANDAVWEHPELRRVFPAGTRQRVQRAWAEHDWFWAATRRLPQTLCHHDAFRDNLFIRNAEYEEPEVVAVDWAMVGRGCLGADLAPLLCASVAHFAFPADRARELAATAFDAYLNGLREADWRGEPAAVRLGFLASLAPWVTVSSGLRYFLSNDLALRVQQLHGKSLPELRETWSTLTLVLLELLDEARLRADRVASR
jgi:hypothetical protein